MRRVGFSKKANSLDSLRNRTSTFGIMGGTITSGNYRNSIRTSTYRATTYNQIPLRPGPGKEYMLAHNLLSRNPQCSGGVGRMHTHPGACGPCNCVGSYHKESNSKSNPSEQICKKEGGVWSINACHFPDSDTADTASKTYDWQKKICGYEKCTTKGKKCGKGTIIERCFLTSDSVLLCRNHSWPFIEPHSLYSCCTAKEISDDWKQGVVCTNNDSWSTNLNIGCKGAEKTYCISKDAWDSVSGTGNPDSLPTLFSKCDSTIISNWWEIECT